MSSQRLWLPLAALLRKLTAKTHPAVSGLVHVPLHLPGVGHQVLHPPVLQRCWVWSGEYGLYSAPRGRTRDHRDRDRRGERCKNTAQGYSVRCKRNVYQADLFNHFQHRPHKKLSSRQAFGPCLVFKRTQTVLIYLGGLN